MKILGIDTTTKFLCLGIYSDNRIYEYNLDLGRQLSGLITVTIKRALDALGWKPHDIDYFACGLGPGSFTGMRVGISAIKGLAFSLNKPVIGIPSLDLLARNAGILDGHVIPVVDAKRNMVYCGIYRKKGAMTQRIGPYMLLTMNEFFKKARFKGNITMLGDGAGLYKQEISLNIKNASVLDKDYWYPSARNIIDLAVKKVNDKKKGISEIEPIYLYPKECQVRKAIK